MAVSSPRPPAQDGPQALIPEARDRQRRRRLLALTAVAVAVALGLGIYAAATGGGFLGSIGRPLALAGPPTCRSTQLRPGTDRRGQPALGVYPGLPMQSAGSGIAIITNASRSACSIPAPQVSVLSQGTRLSVSQVQGHPFSFGPDTVVHGLKPGQSAHIGFVWQNWCGTPARTTIRVGSQNVSVPWAAVGGPPPVKLVFRFATALTLSGQVARPSCAVRGSPSTITVDAPRDGAL